VICVVCGQRIGHNSAVSSAGYRLVKLANGVHSLHSLDYRETMHPALGPAAEAEVLYVRQLRLAERLRGERGEFVVWDVGLGGAANAIAVLRAIEGSERPVRVVSFDCTVEPLVFALEHKEALGYLGGYEGPVQQLARTHRVAFDRRRQSIAWDLHLADFPALLTTPVAKELPKPHVILFDAFSPARNPAMWTLPVFTNLFSLLDPNRPSALATYSRSTLLRVTLLLAGFFVGAGHATGQKEETTIAANRSELIEAPLDAGWLGRAHRSRSAEPLQEAEYRQAPLSAATWEKLRRHPQFNSRGRHLAGQ
jgi:hypothetical protein